jgi:uncharacterized membrane protein YeaQ/YmgE (transglycosylase-associated protein family)
MRSRAQAAIYDAWCAAPGAVAQPMDRSERRQAVGVWSLIVFLVVGLVAGWLAGKIMKGRGFGLLGNLAVGVVGSFVGGLVFRLIGLAPTHIVGSLISAVVGAIVLLYLVGLLKKA